MMEHETLALIMGLSFFALLFAGFPVAVALTSAGLVFGYFGFGTGLFNLLPIRIYGLMENYTLMAIPLFVFLGVMLERSKLAAELLDVIGHAAGPVRGGMGAAVIFVGVLMGASTGIVGATVVTLGLLTLPVFLRRGYSKALACGTICASGTLGQIIPPSLVLILLADIMGLSLGTLFAAALVPGLILAGIFLVYMLAVGLLRPDMAPAIPAIERDGMSRPELAKKLVIVVTPPIALIVTVLGSIVAGFAAPTEAASMGAVGAILVVLLSGRLTLEVLTDTVRSTLRISAMVFFILICSQAFSLAFRGLHGEDLIADLFALIPGGVTGGVLFMLGALFILGFFLDWIEICYIVLPLFLPIFPPETINYVWLAMLVCMNLQTSFLTPPVGWSLFFLKGVAPKGVTIGDIYSGVLPYVGMQLLVLVALYFVPALATWLPNKIGW
jgi:tripartite ATP-independent transporter DctM subunit